MGSINIVDIIALIVIAISALLAWSKGFVREVLWIAAWIMAAAAAVWAGPHLLPYWQPYIESPLLAEIANRSTIFLVTLIVFVAITHMITRRIHDGHFGVVDRTLGLGFGVARGALIVVLGVMLLQWLIPDEKERPWLAEARLAPYIAVGSEMLVNLVPKEWVAKGEEALSSSRDALDPMNAAQNAINGMSNGTSGLPDSPPETGYQNREREDLERRIEEAPELPSP